MSPAVQTKAATTAGDHHAIETFLTEKYAKEVESEARLKRKRKGSGKCEILSACVFYAIIFLIVAVCTLRLNYRDGLYATAMYGYIMVAYLLVKVTLALVYRPKKNEAPDKTVTAVIPSYNENPEAVMCILTSLLNQTYPIKEIYFVDDGSRDTSAYEAMLQYKAYLEDETQSPRVRQIPKIIVHRLAKNQGKRVAQAYAFERLSSELVLTVDSDGYLYPDALEELVKPFADDKVVAATGHVNALNDHVNFFTRLLDMRYDNAFHVERGAQSLTGNVLCCSGPISCYKAGVICAPENIRRYTGQTLFGKPVSVGDDRCLTNFCIPYGKTLYQSTAKCDSNVPTKYGTWVKQQVRWNKSFFRESCLTLKLWLKKPIAVLWTLSELGIWLVFLYSLIFNVILGAAGIRPVDVAFFLVSVCLSAYARNVFFMFKSFPVYLMAPLYGLIHLFTINLVRVYSLVTINVNKWGTR